ncbi:MAG TPA: hypothetical protein PLD84_10040, partial [Chitinophagales bacterium]|nr:hypothetical protein [Chitinophagales bacterium]
MMRSFFYFIGFSFLVSPLHAQTYFKKAIDDPGLTGEKIYLEAITPADNNRYLIAGYVQTAASEQKGLVMAVDDEANIIWQKQFESDTGFSLTTAALLDDKLYLGGSMNDDGIVIICDTTGNLLQSLKITSTSDQYTSINGMVAINGKMYLNCYGAVDGFHLMRIDGNGVAASLVKYTYEPNFNVKGMVAGEDNMYMYGSLSTSYGEVYGVVAKVDTNGFIKWSKQFHMDNTYELYIHKVVVNADNTLQLFCSVPDNFTGEPNRLLQIRVNANGSEISHQAWEKTSDYFFEVTGAVADGSGYTVCSSASYYDTDTLILQHFNQSMVAEWTMGYGSTDESYTRAIAALPGNATLLTHYRLSTGNGVLHKVGSDGASCDSAPFALLDDDE